MSLLCQNTFGLPSPKNARIKLTKCSTQIIQLGGVDGFVELGKEVFCRWPSENACEITIAHLQCAVVNNPIPDDKNSSTPPTAFPSPTTSCSSKPSQKHRAQETGTYDAKELSPNILQAVLYQAHNGMP